MYTLHLDRGPHGITRYVLATADSMLDAWRWWRGMSMPGAPVLRRIERSDDLYLDRQGVRLLLEDALVAARRFAWAARRAQVQASARPGRRRRSRSAAATADLEAHRGQLWRANLLLSAAGGDTLLDEHQRRLAQSIARDRLHSDALQRRCLCGSAGCRQTVPAADQERAVRRLYRAAGLKLPARAVGE